MTAVLVVGAGIAGLTTALSMHAAGVECRVVDRARALTAAGVGINLQPHAVRELTELGLGETLFRNASGSDSVLTGCAFESWT